MAVRAFTLIAHFLTGHPWVVNNVIAHVTLVVLLFVFRVSIYFVSQDIHPSYCCI